MPTQEDFERCRTFRHFFEVLDVARTDQEYRSLDQVAFIIKLRCVNCTTRRTDELDESGELIDRDYEYADGYRTKRGDVRPSLQELRLRLLGRHEAAGRPPLPRREVTHTSPSLPNPSVKELETNEASPTLEDWRDASRRA